MMAVRDLGRSIGDQKAACEALGIPRASYYRHFQPENPDKERPRPPLALTAQEEQSVLDELHSERFQDKAPQEVYATLLDEGRYLCSIRTMYRILEKHQEANDRRSQVRRTEYPKPELLATGPNQVWSWDITKLKGPAKWTYFYLYVILDIFSRYIVGWMVAERESSTLAERLIFETCEKQGIVEGQLTIHADRGSSMRSKPVAHLLSDLGVTKTHTRPYTSNDNPYSESQFKTYKHCPEFPGRFGSIQHSRDFSRYFIGWYNTEHRHTGLNLLTPEQVHYGEGEQVIESRNQVLHQAYMQHPQRFKNKAPKHAPLPQEVWINKPQGENAGV